MIQQRARRRAPVMAALAIGGIVAAACVGNDTGSPSGPEDPRPNILFVLTNDQHTAMLDHMPIVQAELVEQGTLFRSAINTYPLCCPSRATIQRGQYAHNTQVFGNSL